MRMFKDVLPRAAMLFVIFTVVCGVVYTVIVTGLSQLIFPFQANGSIIRAAGSRYGSELLGQQYTDEGHMWGRIMKLDTAVYRDKEGRRLMYAVPSNLSPASDEYRTLVAERVSKLRQANPEMGDAPIPVDLVTCSGSGLDPHISPAAARYQAARLARARNISEEKVQKIIDQCTDGRFLGVFGEEHVNVLEVNLMLDGVLPLQEASL